MAGSADPGALAALVRGFRARSGLSQRELAEAAGVSAASIGLIESGRRGASAETIERLGRALRLKRNEVLDLKSAQAARDASAVSMRTRVEQMYEELQALRALVEKRLK